MIYISKQQEQIVTSNSKHKLINGCAGSRKTDTLIKCAIRFLNEIKKPILFLTLVGSVTDEIKTRLEQSLGIIIDRQGYSNHYIGYYNGIPICISNYDAWVHIMIQDMDGISDIGSCFSEKVDKLLDKTKTESLIFYMKNKIKVGALFLDEMQDLGSNKMEIIVNLCLKNEDLYSTAAGDYLQTLFNDENMNSQNMDIHAMNIYKRVTPDYFDLNICMRCPKGHVDLNNLLLRDIQKKYMIPIMESDNDNIIDKPVLFTHLPTSYNTNARIIAEQLTNMIRILIAYDNTIIPDDIAIIMGKTKNNEIYFQLQDTLNKLYETLGYSDSVLHMNTDGDGKHNSLDWKKAEGKTKLLSIHGDKGRGHKVVFFLGLTENSIPRDIYINKPSEIIPESLLNVGLTRSTKYLFIGFTYNRPSRYLQRFHEKLSDFVYSPWNKSGIIPEPYNSIICCELLSKTFKNPHWEQNYREEKILTGTKQNLAVTGDISKDFEQAKNIIMYPWKKSETVIKFGNNQEIHMPLQEEHYQLIGIMSELLIQRLTKKQNLFNYLKQSINRENTIFTDDERFLSCMYDIIHNYGNTGYNDYMNKFAWFFNKNIELKRKIENAVFNKKNVVHSVFSSEKFKNQLEEFISECDNKDIKTETIWNVSLFYNQITQKIYRPAVNSLLGYFNEDIDILHDNISKYVITYLKQNNVMFEHPIFLSGDLNPVEKDLLKIDNSNHTLSISGRCDIYSTTNESLYEIKASRIKGCSQEWLIQTLMYVMMLDIQKIPVKNIFIVNVLNGCLYKWEVPPLPELESIILNKIGKRYDWNNLESKALIRGIADERFKYKKYNHPILNTVYIE